MAPINKHNDPLTEVSIEEKKAEINACIASGTLSPQVGQGILNDLDKAMSKAGSSMTEISPKLSLSTPVCVNEDNKPKSIYDKGLKKYTQHFVQGVKGGHVVMRGFSDSGEDKYTCYPPLEMVLEICNNSQLILDTLAKKASSGHIFKKIGTTRVEQLTAINPNQIDPNTIWSAPINAGVKTEG